MSSSVNHQHVIDGLTELYKTLVDMQYLPADLVKQPPHDASDHGEDGESLNSDVCKEVGFDDEVFQLMQKLPYITGDEEEWFVAPFTHPISYLREWRLENGRDPAQSGRNELPSHALALTWGAPYGTFLIYDTKTGKITDWVHELGDDSDAEEAPTPAKRNPRNRSISRRRTNYTNLPAKPAEEAFKTWINYYKTLQWLPVVTKGQPAIVAMDQIHEAAEGAGARRDSKTEVTVYDALTKVYRECGWPENFRKEEFAEKRKKWEENEMADYLTAMAEEMTRKQGEDTDEE